MKGRAAAITLAITLLVGASVLASCGAQAKGRVVPPTSTRGSRVATLGAFGGLHWLVAASGLEKMASVAGQDYVRRYFDSPNVTVIAPSVVPAWLAGWRVTFADDVKSVGTFNRLVSNGPSQRSVLFDPEHWSFTPLSEQANPLATASAVASKAQALDVKVISAPAANLAEVIAPGANIWNAYLSSGIVAAYAKYSSAIDIQAQGLEGQPSVYREFVDRAAAMARQANPNVVIYAGISTNPSGQQVSAATIVGDIEATRDVVSGYWLNVPSGGVACPRCGVAEPQVAVSVVDRLSALRG